MSLTMRISAVARDGVRQVRAYYESQRVGLGGEFARELGRTLRDILQYPKSSRIHSKRCRRRNLKRFPYGVVYHIADDGGIDVITVMYLGRDPTFWHDRL